MKTIKFIIPALTLILSINTVGAQPRIRIISGQIALNDFTPTEAKYKAVTDTLDRKLRLNPNDTTALFYRSVLYLSFNSMMAKPSLSSSEPTGNLLTAKKMADRADSLKMKDRRLKILNAQICKQLTYRYAPADNWRFNAAQLAARKEKYEYYKDLANRQYDELALLDKSNASDYQRLKVK